MPVRPPSHYVDEESIEECIEALDELVLSLQHHPPHAVAQAIGVHLESLLGALFGTGECTPEEVRQFLAEIGNGALSGPS